MNTKSLIILLLILSREIIPIKAQFPNKLYFISDCQEPMKVEKLFRTAYRNEEARDSLFSDIIRQQPRNLFLLGDLTSAGSNKKSWKPIDSLFHKLRKQNISINAIPGNHEYYTNAKKGIKNYQKRFPENPLFGCCIKVDSMAVVMLNSNFNKLTSPEIQKQQIWYEQTLDSLDSNRGIKVILVCAHHAPYTNSTVVKPSEPVILNFLPRFIKSPKARLFMSGHSHNLEYFKDNPNKYYLVIGGGGGLSQPLRLPDKCLYNDQLVQSQKPLYFYVTIERKGNCLYLQSHGLKKDFNATDILEIGRIELLQSIVNMY